MRRINKIGYCQKASGSRFRRCPKQLFCNWLLWSHASRLTFALVWFFNILLMSNSIILPKTFVIYCNFLGICEMIDPSKCMTININDEVRLQSLLTFSIFSDRPFSVPSSKEFLTYFNYHIFIYVHVHHFCVIIVHFI